MLYLTFSDSTRSAQESGRRMVNERRTYLSHRLPLIANDFIEDHDPEWRDLDYTIQIASPPKSFCQFFVQYECNIFKGENITVGYEITFSSAHMALNHH